jgi:hypothetical protein
MNRFADPAIECCAPLDWMESWLDQHRNIEHYILERHEHTMAFLNEARNRARSSKYALGLGDLRARLYRILRQDPRIPPPMDRVKG